MMGPADQAKLDVLAKQQGFPDYNTMMAWQAHRTESLQNSHTTVNAMPQAAPAPAPTNESTYQKLMRIWHSAVS